MRRSGHYGWKGLHYHLINKEVYVTVLHGDQSLESKYVECALLHSAYAYMLTEEFGYLGLVVVFEEVM